VEPCVFSYALVGYGTCVSNSSEVNQNCNYSPLYTAQGDWRTGWYESARISDTLTVTALHYLPSGVLGASAAIPAHLPNINSQTINNNLVGSGSLVGVFGVDFSLTALTAMMDALQGGCPGRLYYVNRAGVVLASSTGGEVTTGAASAIPASAHPSTYVVDSNKLITADDAVSYASVTTWQWLEDHVLVGIASATSIMGAGSAMGDFVNVASLDRLPLYFWLWNTSNLTFIVFLITCVLLGLIATRALHLEAVQNKLWQLRNYSPSPSMDDFKLDAPASEVDLSEDDGGDLFTQKLYRLMVYGVATPGSSDPDGSSSSSSASGAGAGNGGVEFSVAPDSPLVRIERNAGDQTSDRDAFCAKLEECAVQFLADSFSSNSSIAMRRIQLLVVGRCHRALMEALLQFQASAFSRFVRAALLIAAAVFTLVKSENNQRIQGDDRNVIIVLFAVLAFEHLVSDYIYPIAPFSKIVTAGCSGGRYRRYVRSALFIVALADFFYDPYEFGVFAYLVLIILESELMSCAVMDFARAIGHSSSVIYLFFASVCILAAMSFVLYEDKFQTSSRYTDQQFRDYLHSWVTMYIYISSHSNMMDILTPSLDLPSGEVIYGLYLVFGYLIGAFFIFALLLEMFSIKFVNDFDGDLNLFSRNRWASVTLATIMWRRSIAYAEPQNHIKPPGLAPCEVGFAAHRSLDRQAFVQLLFQACRFSNFGSANSEFNVHWLVELRRLLQDLCNELVYDATGENRLPYRNGNLRPGDADLLHHVGTYLHRLCGRARGIAFYPIGYAAADPTAGGQAWNAGELLALASVSSDLHREEQYCEVVELVAQCTGTPGLQTNLVGSQNASREAQLRATLHPDLHAIEQTLPPDHKDNIFLRVPATHDEMQRQLVDVTAWHGLQELCASGKAGHRTFQILRLVQLSALHKWRLAAIAEYVIDHGNRSEDDTQALEDARNLYNMMALGELTSQCAVCKWLQLDVELSQVQMDIDQIQEALSRGENVVECDRLQRTARGKYEMDELITELEAEHWVLETRIRHFQAKQGTGHWTNYFRSEKVHFLLMLLDLSNILAASLYVTGISIDGLDAWLCVYPVVHLLCLLPTWFKGFGDEHSSKGFVSWLLAHDDPIKSFARIFTFSVVCTSLVGMILLLSKPDNVHVNISRTLTSTTCFLVFVHGKHFFLILATLVRALALVAPFFATMGVLAILFGKMCQDIYGSDIDTNDRYQSLKTIVLTGFQLFTGCGWHEVMWEFTSQSNFGTTALFCVYMFVSSLLFGQLILGVVISISEEVLEFKSVRVNKLVTSHLKGLQEYQREAFLKSFYAVSCQLAHINEEIHRLGKGKTPIYMMPKSPESSAGLHQCCDRLPDVVDISDTASDDTNVASHALEFRGCDILPQGSPEDNFAWC